MRFLLLPKSTLSLSLARFCFPSTLSTSEHLASAKDLPKSRQMLLHTSAAKAAQRPEKFRESETTSSFEDDAGAGVDPDHLPTTLSERLEFVTKRFLHDISAWTAFDDGHELDMDEVRRAAAIYLAPGSIIHVDGLLGTLVPPTVTGPHAYFSFLEQERAAYRSLGLETLLVAVDEEQDSAFALSTYRVENVGSWLGRGPTGRVSEGIRIDEIRFNSEAKVVEAWCNRQLFEEEREVLLRDPHHHHAAVFDRSRLRKHVADHENGSHGPLAPQKMMRVAGIWVESWNVATASGSFNPDLLDTLMEDDFAVHDLMGFTGDDPEHMAHTYTDIHSRDQAKQVMQQLTDKYDVDEGVVRMAAHKGSNAVFCHWRARLLRRTSEAVAAREAVAADPYSVGPGPVVDPTGTGSTNADTTTTTTTTTITPSAAPCTAPSAAPSYVIEVTEMLLFSPAGKLHASYQFRRPLGSDRRAVLVSSAHGLSPHGGVGAGGLGGVRGKDV